MSKEWIESWKEKVEEKQKFIDETIGQEKEIEKTEVLKNINDIEDQLIDLKYKIPDYQYIKDKINRKIEIHGENPEILQEKYKIQRELQDLYYKKNDYEKMLKELKDQYNVLIGKPVAGLSKVKKFPKTHNPEISLIKSAKIFNQANLIESYENQLFKEELSNERVQFNKKYNKIAEKMENLDYNNVKDSQIIEVGKYYNKKRTDSFINNYITSLKEYKDFNNIDYDQRVENFNQLKKNNNNDPKLKKILTNNFIDTVNSVVFKDFFCVIGENVGLKSNENEFKIDTYSNKVKFLEFLNEYEKMKKKEEKLFKKQNKDKSYPDKTPNGEYYLKIGENKYNISKIKNIIEDDLVNNKNMGNPLFNKNDEFFVLELNDKGLPLGLFTKKKNGEIEVFDKLCFLNPDYKNKKLKPMEDIKKVDMNIFKEATNINDITDYFRKIRNRKSKSE